MNEINNRWPKGIKKTKQRTCVLTILKEAAQPLSAAEIYERLGGGEASLSTVYRILELFAEKEMVVKAVVPGSDKAVYALNRFGHKHYAVCLSCHKIIEMENCPMDSFIPKLKDDAFQVTGHNIEIFGLCRDCKHRK